MKRLAVASLVVMGVSATTFAYDLGNGLDVGGGIGLGYGSLKNEFRETVKGKNVFFKPYVYANYSNVRIGLSYLYFKDDSTDTSFEKDTGYIKRKSIELDIGYDYKIQNISLMPYAGIGKDTFEVGATYNGNTDSDSAEEKATYGKIGLRGEYKGFYANGYIGKSLSTDGTYTLNGTSEPENVEKKMRYGIEAGYQTKISNILLGASVFYDYIDLKVNQKNKYKMTGLMLNVGF